MEWWMWVILTWPFAGVAAYEFIIWSERKLPHPRLPSRKAHVLGVVLSALLGWALVVFVLLACFDDMQG